MEEGRQITVNMTAYMFSPSYRVLTKLCCVVYQLVTWNCHVPPPWRLRAPGCPASLTPNIYYAHLPSLVTRISRYWTHLDSLIICLLPPLYLSVPQLCSPLLHWLFFVRVTCLMILLLSRSTLNVLLPVPASSLQRQLMWQMLSPPCFTVGMVPGLLQKWRLAFRPKSSILFSSDQRILFLTVWESLGAFWQNPSWLTCAFYWVVASIWP